MDSLTLSLVIIVFLASLGLYFATASPVVFPPPPPLPEKPKCHRMDRMDIKIAPVLRQNVVAARLMSMQCLS